MPSVGFEATDLFGLGAQFHAQTSSSPVLKDRANFMDAQGNVECEVMINERTEHSTPYIYCNLTPGIKGDLGLFLTLFGNVFDSKKVTQLVIGFPAGQFATVDLTGHQHAQNPHTGIVDEGRADVSGVIPAGAGFGVPSIPGVVLGANAAFVSATYTFGMTHVDVLGAAGEFFVGKNLTPVCDLSIEFTGIPDVAVSTGFTVDSQGPGDANQAFDTFAIAQHKHFDLLT